MRRADGIARAALVCAFLVCVGVLANVLRVPVSAQASRGIPFQCFVAASTATTLTGVGGACTGRGNGDALYITDINYSSNVAAIGADAFNTLKYGFGTTCATGTTAFWGSFTANGVLAATTETFSTPLRVPPGQDICYINSTAGTRVIVITGYEAP